MNFNPGTPGRQVYTMAQEDFQVRERTGVRTRVPHKDCVVFHNDEFTTMDFVIEVLRSVFNKTELEAFNIMMDVHKKGKGIVGTYSYDIAVSKRDRAVGMAREEGFPLRITVEQA